MGFGASDAEVSAGVEDADSVDIFKLKGFFSTGNGEEACWRRLLFDLRFELLR